MEKIIGFINRNVKIKDLWNLLNISKSIYRWNNCRDCEYES